MQFNFFDYVINYIKYTDAKLVITSMDNDASFYKIKSTIPILTIFFQNGSRNVQQDIFSILETRKNLKKLKNKNHVDLMFVFNKITGDLYKKFIRGKTIISGSVLGNDQKIVKKKKKFTCLYFSLPAPERRQIYNEEKELLKIIEKYCYERKIKLTILCKFFKNILAKVIKKYHFTKIILRKNMK